jgi:hypothetical protein
MRENRLYGSEGGEVKSLPYPYQTKATPKNYRFMFGFRGEIL